MKAEALIEALRELQGRGWPLGVSGKNPFGWRLDFDFPDKSCEGWMVFMEDLEKPMPQKDEALIMGWLVSQLEARGLRRWVWPEHSTVRVNIGKPGKPNEPNSFDSIDERVRRTELEALIACCLSLPTEAAHDS